MTAITLRPSGRRADELRAEGKKGARKADGLQDLEPGAVGDLAAGVHHAPDGRP